MSKTYIQDKLDDTLWEAKLVLLQGGSEIETHVCAMAALVELLAYEVANWTVREHEDTLLTNGIDPCDEQDDLKDSIKLSLFKCLKDVVEDWKKCAGC